LAPCRGYNYKLMKYLPKETCEYLVSLRCSSESEKWHCPELTCEGSPDPVNYDGLSHIPAFSLEDILRKDNAEKIWPGDDNDWSIRTEQVLRHYQHTPDTWTEKVAQLIKPLP